MTYDMWNVTHDNFIFFLMFVYLQIFYWIFLGLVLLSAHVQRFSLSVCKIFFLYSFVFTSKHAKQLSWWGHDFQIVDIKKKNLLCIWKVASYLWTRPKHPHCHGYNFVWGVHQTKNGYIGTYGMKMPEKISISMLVRKMSMIQNIQFKIKNLEIWPHKFFY